MGKKRPWTGEGTGSSLNLKKRKGSAGTGQSTELRGSISMSDLREKKKGDAPQRAHSGGGGFDIRDLVLRAQVHSKGEGVEPQKAL